jgi:flagellar assembly protein FliH
MRARPTPFTFAREFGSPGGGAPAAASRHDAEEGLAAASESARAAGYAEGYDAGRRDRAAAEAGRAAAAAENVAAAAGALLGTLDAERARLEREAVGLAVTVARLLARTLVEREPLAAIEGVAAEALGHLRSAPHLVVRVAPDLVEPVEARLKRLAWERGYEGRIVVLGEPDEALGDVRVEWADGGLVRDRAALEALAEAAVQRFLAAKAAGEPE